MIHKTLHKKLDWATWISQKPRVNSCASLGQAVPAPLVAPIVVLLLQTLWKIMNEGQDYDYDKRNISVVISHCDKYSQRLTSPGHGDVCKSVEVVIST